MGSEYAIIYMNMSNCFSILNIPKSVGIYLNVGKFDPVCLTLRIWLYMSEMLRA